MTWREAVTLLRDFPYNERDKDLSSLQQLIEALQIVEQVKSDASVDADHDCIYFGPEVWDDDDPCPYSEAQIKRLAELHVHWDDECDSLAYFT